MREYRLECYAALLSELVTKHDPSAVVAVATNRGRELLASAAADTENGLISDVIDLRLEDGQIIGQRPAFAGKVLMEMTANTATAFVTIRGRAFQPAAAADAPETELEVVKAADVADGMATEIESFASELGKVSLTDAAIIVSGGRGMASNPKSPPDGLNGDEASIWKAKDGYEHTLRPLAEVLGAAVGASRAAVDAGYIPYEHQVGQTGKVLIRSVYRLWYQRRHSASGGHARQQDNRGDQQRRRGANLQVGALRHCRRSIPGRAALTAALKRRLAN